MGEVGGKGKREPAVLAWNRGEGNKFDEHDYSTPAIKELKIAAVAVAKSKIGLTYGIFRLLFFIVLFF
jgi:hypothetical protein